MTATAVEAPPSPAQTMVPAVASFAIRHTVTGRPQHARVLGAATHAVWLSVGREVVVLSSRDATRLPNSVEVGLPASAIPFERLGFDEPVVVGDGTVLVGGLAADAVRWWDPRPLLPSTSRRALADRIAGFRVDAADPMQRALGHALMARDATGVLASAGAMLGRGPGLTPEADDYLAGVLAAVRCFAPALRVPRAVTMLDAIEAALSALAGARTTTFSASLIRHALAGNVAAPAGALLRAFAGRGDVDCAYRRLLDVGHTSGPALAAGMVLGANGLIEGDDT